MTGLSARPLPRRAVRGAARRAPVVRLSSRRPPRCRPAHGRPRRIFLVGADGGAHPNFKRPYFYYDEIDAEGPEQDFLQRPDMLPFRNRPDLLEEANRRL